MRLSNKDRKLETAHDFDQFIKDLIKEYGNIFFSEIDGQTYIYKALGRKTYKSLVRNPEVNIVDLEDKVCEETVLYPLDFNPEECDAGIPTELFKQILANSFLTDTADMISLINVCREEVDELDIQMSCIISEAFPAYDIDEIEEWDMIKFCRMYARAEWKLKNIRNLEVTKDVVDILSGNITDEENTTQEQPSKQSIRQQALQNQSNERKVKVGSREMTQEEYKQYLEIQKQFPDIDWGADAMFTGYESQNVDTVPTPLRTRR